MKVAVQSPSVIKKLLYPLFLLLNLHTHQTTAAIKSQSFRMMPQKPPEIALKAYSKADSYQEINVEGLLHSDYHYQNDFISRNGSDFVISPETATVMFSCEASYPISWKFPDPKQFQQAIKRPYNLLTEQYRISDFNEQSAEPISKQFVIHVEITCTRIKFLSAALACISVENRVMVQSSVYIYLSGKLGLENEGETLTVSMESLPPPNTLSLHNTVSNLSPLVLPCRPSSPDLKISIEKETLVRFPANRTLQKVWKPLSIPEPNLKFDPKIGFIVERRLLGNRLFGLYKCTVRPADSNGDNAGEQDDLDNKQFVLVNVTNSGTPGDLQAADTFQSRSNLHGKASFQTRGYSDTYLTEEIICCSGVKNKPPFLHLRYCDTLEQCAWMKQTIMREIVEEKERLSRRSWYNIVNGSSDCIKKFIYDVSALVVCKGENVDVMEQFINILHPEAGGPVMNRSNRILQSSSKPQNHQDKNTSIDIPTSLSIYETAAVVEAAPSTRKVIILVTRPVKTPPPVGYGFPFILGQRYLLVVEEENATYDDPSLPMGHIGFLQEYDRDVYFTGEPLHTVCIGIKLLYSQGAHLRLNWDNGSKTVLSEGAKTANELVSLHSDNLYLSGDANLFNGEISELVSVHISGKTVYANLGMTSVDCYMPVQNSSRWDKVTKSLKVWPSVAPKFAQPEKETIYVYLGEDHIVHCTVIEGLPFPNINVTKDGLPVRFDFNTNSTWDTEAFAKLKKSFSIDISLESISHAHQGVVQCIADNVNATVSRTVTVFVIERPSKAVPILLGLVGTLVVILGGLLGVKRYWLNKRTTSL